MRPLLTLVAILGGLTQSAAVAGAPAAASELPPIRHVFVLVLENMSYSHTFAADSDAPYLAHTLPRQGALLTQYFAIGHASLDNYVALVSGQAPNHATQLDCPTFSDFRLSAPALNGDGQALGSGCVYPPIVKTLPDQLEQAGFTWKAYMEDMGNDPRRERATCGHVPLGASDPTSVAQRGDQYAAKHDPFVYFHSIIDNATRCDTHVVNLARLPGDLASAATTPNYVFITPNLCSDGHDPKCVDGRAGGLIAINVFLTQWVPLIVNSPAFRADGMLIVTFDEADGIGAEGSGACCGEKPLPGARYAPGFNGPGGGRVGAVILSPFVRPGTVSTVAYNHYSLLHTVEAIFGLEPLGYAASPGARVFGADVFSGAAPRPPAR
ncbi:MAG TPA: alkaline phosphatase family protein [Steroidobacteraceae bacterium]|nr:alkaline phosphatase family protein [Steroidobacteraceae bacterium]